MRAAARRIEGCRPADRATFVLFALFLFVTPVDAQIWGSAGFDLWTLPAGAESATQSPINSRGEVSGWIFREALRPEALIFRRGSVTPLGYLERGPESKGYGINDRGEVTGIARTGWDRNRAFHYSADSVDLKMADLGALGSASHGYAINDAGVVTGYTADREGYDRAFRADRAGMRNLGTLGGTFSYGVDINGRGQVAGWSRTAEADMPFHAFRFSDTADGRGEMRDLGTLGGSYSYGYAINDAGMVAGYSRTREGSDHAFRYTDDANGGRGGIKDLGAMEGVASFGYGIDRSGRVVGKSQGRFGENLVHHRATFWEGDIGFFLEAVVQDGWRFTELRGISDDGRYMLAQGSHTSYNGAAYEGLVVLEDRAPVGTVTPEPVSMALLGTGLAGLAAARRHRKRRAALP